MKGRYFRDISTVRAGGESTVPLPVANEVVVFRSFMKARLCFPLHKMLVEVLKNGADPEQVATDKNLIQVSDEGAIIAIVDQVLADNAKAAEDVKNGEMKAIGFLVGQVMKASQGKANPAMAQELIKKQLGI